MIVPNNIVNDEYFYKIIDLVPASIYWKDREGKYLGCNQYMLNMAQAESRADIIAKKDSQLPWHDIAQELRKIDTHVMESQQVCELEETPLLANKQRRVFMTTKSPLYNEAGEVVGIIGVSVDITEKKIADDLLLIQKQALEEKTVVIQTMAASMAHELRTPLSSISSGLIGMKARIPQLVTAYQHLQQGDDSTPINLNEYKSLPAVIESMQSEVKAALMVIDMLLIKRDLSEIDSSQFKLYSIVSCVEEALLRYAFKRGERELVHWQGGDFYFVGDELLMVHVLFNLFKNAIYYIKAKGAGDIRIWCDKNESFNFLHVKDTAEGIAADILPRIFDRFFTHTPKGTGVGLAFCKMVMQSFGGDIVCHSKQGEYSEFVLSFPVKK